jgi:hypothetical protein
MATYGFIVCKACREHIFLGKWVRREGYVGVGFWHGQLCEPDERDSKLLGRKALRFLARHMDHDILVGSDDGGAATDIVNSEEYVDADDIYDAIAREDEPEDWPSPRHS